MSAPSAPNPQISALAILHLWDGDRGLFVDTREIIKLDAPAASLLQAAHRRNQKAARAHAQSVRRTIHRSRWDNGVGGPVAMRMRMPEARRARDRGGPRGQADSSRIRRRMRWN